MPGAVDRGAGGAGRPSSRGPSVPGGRQGRSVTPPPSAAGRPGSRPSRGEGPAARPADRSPAPSAADRSSSTPASGASPSKRDGRGAHLVQAGYVVARGGAASARGLPLAPEPALPEESREELEARLASAGFLSHTNELHMHGRAYSGPAQPPKVTWSSDQKPRKDHAAPDWLTATEFQDTAAVLNAKCSSLANLLRLSRKTVLYTGAGISASAVGQAALSGQNKVGWKPQKLEAKPTPTHCALGLLGREGLIHGWVQQNHDGLPQKAGFPQEHINEIHGSWYDPCNPVVKYSGTLHERAFPWMEDDAETADLVVVLGTSLGGLNADQVATNAAERSLAGGFLGTVIINLQQTEQDGKMTLCIHGRSDDVLAMVLRKMGFQMPRNGDLHLPKTSRALVPYDATGRRLPAGSTEKRMWLDLADRQQIRITEGHNIQGAKQAQFMHIGTPSKPGAGRVLQRDESTCSFSLSIEGACMRLGIWWLDAAERGAVDMLPIVNVAPRFEGEEAVPGPPAKGRGKAPGRGR